MLLKSKVKMSLNWKKANKVYNFFENQTSEVPEEVAEYLLKNYNGKFEPIINLIVQKQVENDQQKTNIPIVKTENGLNELTKGEIDVKQVIERALEKEIIKKNNACYFFNNTQLGKSVKALKEKLEQDGTLLQEIKNKI
jgi:hypothetical protein